MILSIWTRFFTRRHFFYDDKSQNSKRYPFANVKSFWHLMWKRFCHSGRENSIKTNLETCNLWTGQYVSFKSVNLFWLNLPHQKGKTFFTSNVKNFSHLQMDIFCCFDFCHCRRNAFWLKIFVINAFIEAKTKQLSLDWFISQAYSLKHCPEKDTQASIWVCPSS